MNVIWKWLNFCLKSKLFQGIALFFLLGTTLLTCLDIPFLQLVTGHRYIYIDSFLKKPMKLETILPLADGRLFLPDNQIYDPRTKQSIIIENPENLGLGDQSLTWIQLQDGRILNFPSPDGHITKQSQEHCDYYPGSRICARDKIISLDPKTLKYSWIDFPLAYIRGGSPLVLPDGDILFTGGFPTIPVKYPQKIGPEELVNNPTIDKKDYDKILAEYNQHNVNRYSFKTKKLTPLGKLLVPVHSHKSVLLSNNQVLLFGGGDVRRLNWFGPSYGGEKLELLDLEKNRASY
jgi:hypothetical protein